MIGVADVIKRIDDDTGSRTMCHNWQRDLDRVICLVVTKVHNQGRKKVTYREKDTEACVYCVHR